MSLLIETWYLCDNFADICGINSNASIKFFPLIARLYSNILFATNAQVDAAKFGILFRSQRFIPA